MIQQPPLIPGYAKPKAHFLKRYFTIYTLVVFLIVSFFGGYFTGEYRQGLVTEKLKAKIGGEVLNKEDIPAYLSKDVNFNLYWQVWNYIKNNYVKDSVVDTKLFYGSLAGMVASLGDPYSMFFDPETADKFNQELSGTFEGIGAEIGIKNNRLTIIAPLPGSPAEKAGLKSGDKVIGINKLDTTGIALDYAVNLIRGKSGTPVTLLIKRDGLDKIKEYTIVREKIAITSVKWQMKQDGGRRVAVIELSYFNEDTAAAFEQAVREILVKNPDAIILDMRNNPGGFLDTAVKVASEWIPKGVIVTEKFRGDKKDDYQAGGKGRLGNYKTVVLINGGSASGSEIVAGALADYGKAILVGKKSFGKGSVQQYESLSDGSAIKVTVAKWFTPKGNSIDEEGIKPDFEVDLTDADYNAGKDPQMDKALELLK